ncbi:serine/threonine protein kinase [Desulfosporosinus meridiei]|uniref:Protein kinase family protein n=1 Tax=Desulfosporosinus meridiei (strain ATCC BAA-275 / DSM 13257 / KCTC 12902 / NCIMB 13706 / S10) TaxID=768704 RepID=J7IWZ4_DESMD|nr:serine/threonine-protein kinase [Desulfosporosinus meridiei]AFQ46250.1 protein kinase family protein [Desulfosporosinus meridiei DSM 13257]
MISPFLPPLLEAEVISLFPNLKSVDSLKPGAEGAVFKAIDNNSQREILLKIYGPDHQHRRTELEIAKLKEIDSPYLVTLYGSGKKVIRGLDCYYIITNFISGDNLQALLESGKKLSEQETIRLIHCISLAIEALWAVDVVHCDIKPENIILDTNGDFILIDLGLAKHLDADAESLTEYGIIFGTKGYLAPEQFLGRKNLTLRADLYALGIVAYQCLAGYHPYNFRQDIMLNTPIPKFPQEVNIINTLEKVIYKLTELRAFKRPKGWTEIFDILGVE